MSDRLTLSNAFALSVLLHGLLLALLPILRQAPVNIAAPLLDVDVVSVAPPPRPVAAPAAPVPPPPVPPSEDTSPPQAAPPPVLLPEHQIVSPPDAGENRPPEEARFLSDRDTSVKEQMIRRGETEAAAAQDTKAEAPAQDAKAEAPATEKETTAGEQAPPSRKPPGADPRTAPRAEAAAQPAARPGPRELAAVPSLDQLLPAAPQLAREGFGQPDEARKPGPPAQRADRGDLLRYGGGAGDTGGRRGVFDYIPDVREGDITLLNTKAEQFSPFVRRVAIRVFQNLVISMRRELTNQARSGQEFVVVEAIMSRKGDLLSLAVKDRSGTSALSTDRHLQHACYEGFFDRNPPPGAEGSDGNIHFLFTTRVNLMLDAGGRHHGNALFSAGLL